MKEKRKKLECRRIACVLRDLTLRRHQSKVHERVWEDVYEKILMYRSICS